MDQETQQLLHHVDRSVNGIRGIYAEWSRRLGIGYHELLVLYALRDFKNCTQRMICDCYLLPKQTVHNIVAGYVEQGFLQLVRVPNGNEKVMTLTPSGQKRMSEIIEPLNHMEEEAVRRFGAQNLDAMTKLTLAYRELLAELYSAKEEE